jgi:hypothetical protein
MVGLCNELGHKSQLISVTAARFGWRRCGPRQCGCRGAVAECADDLRGLRAICAVGTALIAHLRPRYVWSSTKAAGYRLHHVVRQTIVQTRVQAAR